MIHMYPKADIPVLQISLDKTKSNQEILEVGRALRPLRNEGVLIIGSGNIVHNLRTLDWNDPEGAFSWALEFDEKNLVEYKKLGEQAHLSVPTPEHYLPLLAVVGASDENDQVLFPIEAFSMGSLSMRSVLFQTLVSD